MRSLKSLLGSKLIKHDTSVLGTAMPFTDLLALFIGQLKSRAEANAGREFEEVVLGRPVFFVDDDPMADQEAENTLVDVARKIGFKDISFQYEPIAAAFDYESTIEKEELVLIVDIGGVLPTSPWCACPRTAVTTTTATMTSSPPAVCTSAVPTSTNSLACKA